MWITGTATGLKDLLTKMADHAVDNGWTVVRSTGGDAPNTDLCYFKGPGYGTGYECYFGVRTYEDAPNNHFCLETRGYTSYDPSRQWAGHPGRSPNTVFTRVWNAAMDYWLAISDRRILLVVKCSNTYHSLYAGFFNPFGNPVEYPYPAYFAGDASTPGPFGNVDTNVRSVAFPGNNAAFLREPGGSWRRVVVYDSSATYNFLVGPNVGVYSVWPYYSFQQSLDNPSGNSAYPPSARMEALRGVPDSMFAMNCYLIGNSQEAGVMGVLEGVYWIPGNTISAEQVLNINGESYRVFIAISRSIESPSQFYAVKEA